MEPAKPLTHGVPRLRLVSGAQPSESPSAADLAPAMFRPSERTELFTFGRAELLIEVTGQFKAAGRPLPQVVALLTQRQIVEEDIECCVPGLAEVLDALASCATVERELSPADASYLRGLKSATPSPRSGSGDPDVCTMPLPARLIAAIDEPLIRRALRVDRLEQAVSWEAAALLNGKSIFEWAALAALRGELR